MDLFSYLMAKKKGGGGGTVNLQEKNVSVSDNGESTITPDTGYDGLSEVNLTVNVEPNNQTKSITITENGTTTIRPDENYDGLSSVEIITNVQPLLPSNYIEYDYITCDEGNSYTIVNSVPVPNGVIQLKEYQDLDALSFETDFSYNLSQLYSNGIALFGGRSASGSTNSLAVYLQGGEVHMHYEGMDTGQTSLTFNLNTKYHLSYTNTGTSPATLTLDNNSASLPYLEHAQIPNTKFTLFNNPGPGSTETWCSNKLRLGRLKIKDYNGTLINDYIPCKRKNDNVAGMYDIVDNIFYTCSTTSLAQEGSTRCVYKVGMWS